MKNRIRFGYEIKGKVLRVFWPGEPLWPWVEAEGNWFNPEAIRTFILQAWRELSNQDQRLALPLFLNQPSPVPDYFSFGEREFVYGLLRAERKPGSFRLMSPPVTH